MVNSKNTEPAQLHATNRPSQRTIPYWSIAWAVSLIGSAAILKFALEDRNSVLGIVVAFIPILISFRVLKAYLAVFKNMDELEKQIEVEALAAGFGAGIIVGIAGVTLESAILFLPWPLTQTMAMMMTYIAAHIFAARKYR